MAQVAQRAGRTQLDRGAERLDDRELPFPIRTSKLRPVAPRRGTVRRRALLDRLQESEAPVIVVIAPAGYGKTTLLSQWVDDEPGRVAWLAGDDGDDDPVVLVPAHAVGTAMRHTLQRRTDTVGTCSRIDADVAGDPTHVAGACGRVSPGNDGEHDAIRPVLERRLGGV